jgi:hypothetical protein
MPSFTQPLSWRHNGIPSTISSVARRTPPIKIGEGREGGSKLDRALQDSEGRIEALEALLAEEGRRKQQQQQQQQQQSHPSPWRDVRFEVAELASLRDASGRTLKPSQASSPRGYTPSMPASPRDMASLSPRTQLSPRTHAVPTFAQRFLHTGAQDPTTYDGWLRSSPRVDVAKLPRQAPKDSARPMAGASTTFFAKSDLVTMLEGRMLAEPPGLPGFPPLREHLL